MIIEMDILNQDNEILFIISSLSVSEIENISEEIKEFSFNLFSNVIN